MLVKTVKSSVRYVLRKCAPALLSRHIRVKWKAEPEFALLPALCDRRRVSFDVGANWGQYSDALRGLSAGVVACEPIPALATFLRRAFGSDVQVVQVALSNRKGTADFFVEDDWGTSSLRGPKTQTGKRTVLVTLETLDSIATSPVGFIKMDVEGHEEEVIEGALGVLARDRPVLLAEIEERHRPGALERIRAALGSVGYCGFFLHDGSIHAISSFKPDEHQNPANAPYPSDASRRQGPGCYINNFLFIHKSAVPEKERRLAEFGYAFAHAGESIHSGA
jgi:FkbM family methyltransferase